MTTDNYSSFPGNALNLDISHMTQDKKLSSLLHTVVNEVKFYAEDQIKHIRKLTNIGLALSIEKDINALLEMIVDEARSLSNADAGTLYILNHEKQSLRFEILQNETLKNRIGGKTGIKTDLPEVQLYIENSPNHSNVSSYVALTGETVNIPDVYKAEEFNFTGTRKYDTATGYKSKSMLVIPLKNHENTIIGVLQLLNAKDSDTGDVIAFSSEYVDLVSALASQAAVALTNMQLIQDLKNLFYSFIKSIATAIDEKSPYTGGHINRVVDLTMNIAEKINECNKGPLKDVHFNEDEMEELRIAAWMHDVGKVTTPEYVVDKATKLEKIIDRIDLIETRFHLIEESIRNTCLLKQIELLKSNNDTKGEIAHLNNQLDDDLKNLRDEFEFIKKCNNAGEFMSDDKLNRIREIASKTILSSSRAIPYLTEDEVNNLCIRKGTLLDEERKIIENHAKMTLKITEQLPFPKLLKNVPDYAGGHHEKLDGTGYPKGLSGKALPLQSRIMAIADIFEALTAKDRPYKKPMKLSDAIKILGFMKKDNHIDSDIFDLFIESKLYLEYAKKELNPEQIDT